MTLPPADPAIEFSIATRGYSKGIAQTDDAQAVIRPELGLGKLKLGAYAKNVTSPDADGEAGLSASYRRTVLGTELSSTIALKTLLGARSNIDRSALELAGAASRKFGPASVRLSIIYSPDDLGGTGRSTFAEIGAGYAISGSATATIGLGRRTRVGGADYVSYNAGLTYSLSKAISADLRWYDNDQSNLGPNYKDRIVASLRGRF